MKMRVLVDQNETSIKLTNNKEKFGKEKLAEHGIHHNIRFCTSQMQHLYQIFYLPSKNKYMKKTMCFRGMRMGRIAILTHKTRTMKS